MQQKNCLVILLPKYMHRLLLTSQQQQANYQTTMEQEPIAFTALAFLARVFAQQSDYVNARDVANAVIQSGKYAMNASVRAVYDNKNTNESIFEIQQNDQNNAGTANDGMATFYSSLPGIGRGDVRIAPSFVSTNYNASDLRRAEWYYIGTGARPGKHVYQQMEIIQPEFTRYTYC
jgi:hypothetical protein